MISSADDEKEEIIIKRNVLTDDNHNGHLRTERPFSSMCS